MRRASGAEVVMEHFKGQMSCVELAEEFPVRWGWRKPLVTFRQVTYVKESVPESGNRKA